MPDLFASQAQGNAPLPARLRPKEWNRFVGQEKLLTLLRGRPIHSMVLYGPPGCGKTTLAQLLSNESGLPFQALSAVSAGLKEVRECIQIGKNNAHSGQRGIVLFIDEIHRFNKAQQDALLEAVESGWIIFVGATTENPSFEVIGPLLSRCQVYRLQALTEADLDRILKQAFQVDVALRGIVIEERAQELLVESAGGDARRMLRTIEVAAASLGAAEGGGITVAMLEAVLQGSVRNYDKAGDKHYDFISAFIKSLRGSDPDAALLYMACMLEAGEDPLFIARRLVVFASEDIGNASIQALNLAVSAFQALERIGMPEGRIILGQAVCFLASCPKSNASYLAIDRALDAVRGRQVSVPNHLRNAPTKTHRNEGAGKGYLYPHDSPGHFVRQGYLPEGFEGCAFYEPTGQGQEGRLREYLRAIRPERGG